MSNKDIGTIRHEYDKGTLSRADLPESPIALFQSWMDDAFAANVFEPNAMSISTVNASGQPSSRMVILRGFDEKGFVFYSNYKSSKGQALDQNKKAALLFYWHPLHRQIRIEGICEKVTTEANDAYFHSRPFGSRVASAASPQSEEIADRKTLDEKVEALNKLYADKQKVDRPAHWGGYCIRPELFEFWMGRPSRLHDRFQYKLSENGWQIVRLAP